MRTIHNALRYVFLILLAAALAVTGGCKKKTPQVPPPQAQAPTATPAAQPPAQPPAETQPSTSSAPATTTGGATAATTEKPSETTAPSKPSPSAGHNGRRNHRSIIKSKPAAPKSNAPATPATQAQQPATKTPSQSATQTQQSVTKTPSPGPAGTETSATPAQPKPPAAVPPPSPNAGNSQITPGMSPVDELRTKQNTMQMIDSCEAGLKGLNRNLSDEEKTTLSNIRNFITQSRAALADGEVELAHNYASKAHQLCDELVKH